MRTDPPCDGTAVMGRGTARKAGGGGAGVRHGLSVLLGRSYLVAAKPTFLSGRCGSEGYQCDIWQVGGECPECLRFRNGSFLSGNWNIFPSFTESGGGLAPSYRSLRPCAALPKTGYRKRGGNVSFGHHCAGRAMAECGLEGEGRLSLRSHFAILRQDKPQIVR
jgi:hypothetical protein